VPRHPNDVNEFNDRDTSPTTVVIHTNGMSNGNGMDTSKKSWSQTLITADGSRVKKKYKKSTLNNSNHIVNGNGIASNGTSSSNQMNSASGTVCNGNGIRKERSLHYCSICSKGFKDKYSVNVHIRTHTGEKVTTFLLMNFTC
jgi:hypothetical protein